jgi:hypothetical protein
MLENAKKIYCSRINEVFQHSEYMYIILEIEKRFVFFFACTYTGIFAVTFQNWKTDVVIEEIK